MSPAAAVVLFSILFPVKGWVATDQPINIDVQPDAPVTLIMTDFSGKPLEPQGDVEVSGKKRVDIKPLFNEMNVPGTYVLFAVPKGMNLTKFVGTPLVVDVRNDQRRDATPGVMVTRIEPLRYATISTDKGDMTCLLYYDVACNTVENFINLTSDRFYDGLTFFRVVPGMLIQTGDPRGDGTGGPGYHLEAEFNNRQHIEGVLSMARQQDPIEKQGAMPRTEAANSAGSQFFICLDYRATKQLDRRYTAFGRVVAGLDVLHAIGSGPVGGPNNDTPQTPIAIKKIELHPVTRKDNPYGELMSFTKPLTLPSEAPATEPTRDPATAPSGSR
jgi:peptidyl-prolyl cis-trans isomerase B (cyclophilin B)